MALVLKSTAASIQPLLLPANMCLHGFLHPFILKHLRLLFKGGREDPRTVSRRTGPVAAVGRRDFNGRAGTAAETDTSELDGGRGPFLQLVCGDLVRWAMAGQVYSAWSLLPLELWLICSIKV